MDLARKILDVEGERIGFDSAPYIAKVEELCTYAERAIRGKTRPREVVGALNAYLYEERGIRNESGSDFLYTVLENSRGNCQALSRLYLSITDALSLPIYGVSVPRHIFVRWNDGRERINIETTNRGREFDDAFYIRKFRIHPKPIREGLYLKDLSESEFLSSVLNSLFIKVTPEGVNLDMDYPRRALELDPRCVNAFTCLGAGNKLLGNREEEIANLNAALNLDPGHVEARLNRRNVLLEQGKVYQAFIDLYYSILHSPNRISRGVEIIRNLYQH